MTAPRPAGQGTGHRQTAAEVLEVWRHRLVSGSNRGVNCACGWTGRGADHQEHIDGEYRAALSAADRDGYQRGRDEMAREVGEWLDAAEDVDLTTVTVEAVRRRLHLARNDEREGQ